MACIQCGKRFKLKRESQRFCSDTCRYNYHAEAKKKMIGALGAVQVSTDLEKYSKMLIDLVKFLEKHRDEITEIGKKYG